MNKAVKAALLSAFICPGSGQFWLKKRLLGCLFMGISLGVLMVVMTQVMEMAQEIAQKIVAGELPNDLSSIYAQVSQIPQQAMATMSLLTWVFMINWVLSILNAYWLGAQADKAANSD
jgi:hypothetical protein